MNCVEQSQLDYYVERFPKLFSDQLGCLNKFKVKLKLKPNSQPMFFRARPVPLALRAKVEQEILKLVDSGVLVPVDH